MKRQLLYIGSNDLTVQMEYFRNKSDHAKIFNRQIEKIIKSKETLKFHKSLHDYNKTPTYNLLDLAGKLGIKNLWVKDESNRFGLNAFKILGASFAIYKILQKDPSVKTFCTATDGNHGRAVAWAARKFNKKAIIFLPGNTVEARILNIKKEGADVIIIKGNYDEAVEIAKEESIKNNWTLIQDSSWDGYDEIPNYITAGYTTMFYEIEAVLKKSDKIDYIFLQAGVGSFAASAVMFYNNVHRSKDSKFIIVEPEKADCLIQSIKMGKAIRVESSLDSIMAGLNCGTPSKSAFEVLKAGADLFITIPDRYSELAMRTFYFPGGSDPKIISGESGAAGLGGLIALLRDEKFKGIRTVLKIDKTKNILIINTEGDTDPVNFKKIITKAPSCFT